MALKLLGLHTNFFFFNDTATTEIYTLSLHDALPICHVLQANQAAPRRVVLCELAEFLQGRSEEHTSELQSQSNLVCRLLLEKKKEPSFHLEAHHAPESADRQLCDGDYRVV